MSKEQKKIPHTRISFAITEDMKNQLDKMAIKLNVSTSELVRSYIEKGMSIEKTKDDIDFIRRQIREEFKNGSYVYYERIVKLILKVGAMTVSMCFFTSRLFFVYILKGKDEKKYNDMLHKSRDKALAYLSIRDTGIDEACERILKGE